MSTVETFLINLLYILNDEISLILSDFSNSTQIKALVVGTKAANVMLKKSYQFPTIDWDINVWNPSSTSHEIARDKLGRLLAYILNSALRVQRHRIQILLDQFYISNIEIGYDISPYLYTHYKGFSYHVGHVTVYTDRYSPENIIDLVALPHKGDYVNFGGVNFLKLVDIVTELKNLSDLPDHPKRLKYKARLETIRRAFIENGLSCNYYRYQVIPPPSFIQCIKDTVMGPIDPLYPPQLREVNRRYIINKSDIINHDKYFTSLPPLNYQGAVKQYTKSSYVINSTLLTQALYPHISTSTIPAIPLLQRAILNAPPCLRILKFIELLDMYLPVIVPIIIYNRAL